MTLSGTRISDEDDPDSPCEANQPGIGASIRCAIFRYSKPDHQNFTWISISYIVHFEKNINFLIILGIGEFFKLRPGYSPGGPLLIGDEPTVQPKTQRVKLPGPSNF